MPSPVPPISDAEIVDERVQLGFFDALKEIVNGKKVTRLDWHNEDFYCLLDKDVLCINTDTIHAWTISKIDIEAKDWVIVP